MSVSSILAFVLAGVAAKAKSVQVARRSEDDPVGHAVMKQMARELREAQARIAELEDDVARANVQYRRDQELIDIWRERALANIPPAGFGQQYPAGPDFRPSQIALQAQLQTAQMNAANAQQAQLAQYAAMQNPALLGAQNLINAELWCNCVPSRSQVWAADRTE
jgi:hypothetical protein